MNKNQFQPTLSLSRRVSTTIGKVLFFIFMIFGASTQFLHAQTVTGVPIVSFDFSSATGSETTYASSYNNATYVNTSTISKGAGLLAGANATTGGNFLTAGYFVSTNWTGASEAAAITANNYYQFTISPKSGYEFRIDSLILQWRSSAAGVTGVTVRSSQNNYGTVAATGTVTAAASGALKLTLTNAITSDSAITLRIYGFGASSGKNFGYGQNPTNASTADINVYGQMTTANIPAAVLSNAAGSSTICLGGSAFIKVAITGGSAPFTVWTTDNLGLKRSFTQSGANDSISVSPQATKTYTMDSVKDAMGHKAISLTGSATVTVTNSPVVSNVGTYTRTLAHNDGLTLTYADGSLCKSWVKIIDASGGTNPGSTTCTANVYSTIPVNNTARYFIPRRVIVVPTTNGNAGVTLFYSQAEFTSFNSAALYHQKLPANSTDTLGVLSKLIVRRTQSDTETVNLTSFTPTSVVWNATNSQWEVTISINDGILGGLYYLSTPFNTNKLVASISHTASTPITGAASASVTVDWPDVSGVTQYRMRIRKVGTSTWNVSTITGSQKVLDYLLFGTSYEVQVRVFESGLGQYIQGEYTTSYTFTTPNEPNKLAACDLPTDISATATSPIKAFLSWTKPSYSANTVVEIREQGTLNWGGTSTVLDTISLNNLIPATTYEYRLRTFCQTGYTLTNSSNYTSTGTFATPSLGVCGTVTGLSTVSTTTNSATVSWSPTSYATSYQVQMRLKNTANWGGTTTTQTSFTFNNLSSSSVYEYQIRAFCNGVPAVTSNNIGAFSSTAEFTTANAPVLPSCLPPTNIVYTPTANSINVSWTAAAYGTSYFVAFRPLLSSTWGGATTTGTSRTFSNLIPSTSYVIRVRTNCANGQTATAYSAYSDSTITVTNALANLAIEGTDVDNVWQVYPNPTRDNLHVDFNSQTEDHVKVEVRDMTGRLIQTTNYQPMIGSNTLDINLGSAADGLYIVQIFQGQTLQFMNKVQKIH